MERKLFAIKMEARDKEAMDHVAEATGTTLASLHVGAIKGRLHRNLGFVLMHTAVGEQVGPDEIALFISNESASLRTKTPLLALDLLEVLCQEPLLGKVRGFLPGAPELSHAVIWNSLDLGRLCEAVGEGYINEGGSLETPEGHLVVSITADAVIELTFRNLARGSMEELNALWTAQRPDHRVLVSDIAEAYLADHPLPAVRAKKPRKKGPGREPEIQVAEEVDDLPGTRGPGKKKGKGKGKKKKKDRKKAVEAVEVVEVAPVVEVDEIEE